MDTDTLTVPQFAEKVGRAPRTVGNWIEKGLIDAHRSSEDGRRLVIPRSELVRLLSARQAAEDRTYAAGAAAGAVALHGSAGYRKAVCVMADTGVALAKHLRDVDLEQPDVEGEHASEYCKTCLELTNEAAGAVAAGREFAGILQIAVDLLRTATEQAKAADQARTALGKDQPDA